MGYVSPFIRKRIVVKAKSIIGCGGGIIVTLYDPDQGPSATMETLGGGMDIVGQAEGFHGLLLENKRKQLYLLKALGWLYKFLGVEVFPGNI